MTVLSRRRSRPRARWQDFKHVPGLVYDAFGGPGGWAVACQMLGLEEYGFEWDEAACQTRMANGFPARQIDVAAVDLSELLYELGRPEGLIESPPCQGFSQAGLKKGHGDSGRILAHIDRCWDESGWVDITDEEKWEDYRSHLVLEPLRWADALRPRWICLEQVPFVLVIWEAIAAVLKKMGYYVWTGFVYAEQYGVPQTRKRAVLIASLDGPVGPPTPTHSRYYGHKPEHLDSGVLKWVTMAEALGWGMTERPYLTLAPGTAAGGIDPQMIGGSGARKSITEQRDRGAWVEQVRDRGRGMVERYGERPGRRADEAPSFTVTGTSGGGSGVRMSWQVKGMLTAGLNNTARQVSRDPHDAPAATILGKGSAYWEIDNELEDDFHVEMLGAILNFHIATTDIPELVVEEPSHFELNHGYIADDEVPPVFVNGSQKHAARRSANEPAPTIHYGHRLNDGIRWLMGDVRSKNGTVRNEDQPAPTLTASMDNGNYQWRQAERINNQSGSDRDEDWPLKRPASTILADKGRGIVGDPGANANATNGKTKSRNDGVRVTVQESSVLQSFPPDYAWQGTRTAQYRQIGDAVPPLLAHAVIKEARRHV